GLRDALAWLAVDHGVEQHHRARRVVVPDVVVDLLEVPDVFAGLRLQRDHRRAEQIVALAHRAVVVGSAVARREVNEPELWIEGGRVPDRGASAHRVVRAGWPRVAAEFAGSRQRVPAPPDLAGLGVERREPTADAELAAGDTAVYEPVVVERRAGD